MKEHLKILTVAIAAVLSVGCSDNKEYETATCALVDVSGTYAHEKADVVRIVKAGIVPRLTSGDSLFVIAIDSNSYKQDNLIAQITLDYVPSKANDQKLALAGLLDEFAKGSTSSKYTDISGAMMLCADYLRNTGSGNRAMFVFSDMQEELKEGLKRDFKGDEFKGIDIAAMNVIKLQNDATDPEIYRGRLLDWEKRLLEKGAKSWEIIVDPVKIPEYIERLK